MNDMNDLNNTGAHPNPARINVILADSQPMVRAGLESFLSTQPMIRILDSFEDGARLFLSPDTLSHCDVLIHEISLPGLDGFKLISHLNSRFPQVAALVYTQFHFPDLFERSIKAGARGFVYKRDEPGVLLQAILDIFGGRLGISPTVNALRDLNPQRSRLSELQKSLTEREREVMALIVDGAGSKDAAAILGVKKSTIDKHRENVRAKLGVVGYRELLMFMG